MKSHTRSQEIYRRALARIPGGVNSPVRAFQSVGMDPLVIARGSGSHLWDVDDNEYIDYVGSWGPLILGHAHPEVVEAATKALVAGSSFGASTEREMQLAEMLHEALPSVEKVRLVSSGTEATMSALRLARAATGRSLVVKFEGCYHGHVDALLVKAGSGVATLGIPGTPGIPPEVAGQTLALPYNSVAALDACFAEFGSRIACVIVEPVVGNMGCVPPEPGYLQHIRDLTAKHGAIFIFDEVMTGFRLAYGGAQQLFGIRPDLTTLGKIIGGGLPVGAYGGRADLMNQIAPIGPVYQAGTLSGNPAAVAAGLATLGILKRDPGIYARLEDMSARLCEGMSKVLPVTVNRVGSMFTFFFYGDGQQGGRITDWDSAARSDTLHFGAFFRDMIEGGVFLPPSQYEAMFMSAAHTESDIAVTVEAAANSCCANSRQ
jgi:glutamate-1-semialdehyde 2,1-aminomutase